MNLFDVCPLVFLVVIFQVGLEIMDLFLMICSLIESRALALFMRLSVIVLVSLFVVCLFVGM